MDDEEKHKKIYDANSGMDAYEFVNNSDQGYAEGKWCGKNWIGGGKKPNNDANIKRKQDIAKIIGNKKLLEGMTESEIHLIITLGVQNFKMIKEYLKSKQTLMENGKLDINLIQSDVHRKDQEKITDLTEKCAKRDNEVIELKESHKTLENRLKDAYKTINDKEMLIWDVRGTITKEQEEKRLKDKEYFKSLINEKTQRVSELMEQNKILLNFREEYMTTQVKIRTEQIMNQLNDTQKELKYMKDLHESKEKGMIWEKDLLPSLEEINTNDYAGMYEVTHVGQKKGGMCDILFRNKTTNNTFLVDMKNNLPHKPVTNIDRDKFNKDIISNDVKGGIMVARNRITNKKHLEKETIGGKTLLYMSNTTEPKQIFWGINALEESISDGGNAGDKLCQVKDRMEKEYLLKCKNSNKLERKLKREKEEIKEHAEFYKLLFGENIETKDCDIVQSETIEKKIIDYDDLEKDRVVKGRRSKYYLAYTDNNIERLQYFSSNSARVKKINSLKEKKKDGKVIKIETETES